MFARIFKLCEMGWKDLTKLKAWSKLSASFNDIAPETFNNPSLCIASATNSVGETVCYCPIETVFMVSAYALSPTATPAEAHEAGDRIDAEIEKLAQRNGVSKCLICVPEGCSNLPEGEWKRVSVYERKIPQSIAMGSEQFTPSHATRFVN